jgi:O-antigen/teichoic acid export membrane protein
MGQLSALMSVLLLGMLVQHFVNNSIAFYERGRPYLRLAALEAGSQLAAHLLAVVLVLLGVGAAALYLRELALGLILGGALAAAGGLTLERPRWLALDEWRQVLADVKGIWLEGMLEGAFQRATVLLTGAVASTGAVGFLYQARRLAVVPHQLLSPVTSRVLLNWLRASNAPRAILVRVLALFVAPLVAAAIACVAFADPIVPWLFGEAWSPVAQLLGLMAGVVVFYSLFGVTKSYLIATRQTRYLLAARVFQWLGLGLPLAVAAWRGSLGVESVAVGLSLSYAFAFIACLIFSLRGAADA